MIKQAVFAFLCIAASPLSVLADGEEPVVDEPVPTPQENQYVRGSQLSYDPFYVLPNQRGYKSIDVGVRGNDIGKPDKTTDFFLMSKFTPSDGIEVGAQLGFGFLNESASNFSSLIVGSKYSLGPQRAAAVNLLMPAGDIKNPGISLGIMNTLALGQQLEINKQLFVGVLKGFTGGSGIVVDAAVEPVLIINPRWVAYLSVTMSSNTTDWSSQMSVDAFPNIDWVISDGNTLNLGLQLGLTGDAKSETTGLYLTLLRTM
jgi:hypothetical protein